MVQGSVHTEHFITQPSPPQIPVTLNMDGQVPYAGISCVLTHQATTLGNRAAGAVDTALLTLLWHWADLLLHLLDHVPR